MSFRFSRTLTAIIMALGLSGSLYAKETAQDVPAKVSKEIAKEVPLKSSVLKPDDTERFRQIENRANLLNKMILSEMVLQKGGTAEALAVYALMLNQEKRPELAERGMQIALDKGIIPLSQGFQKKWQEFEPNPTFAQKRMAWEQSVAMKDTQQAVADFPQLLKDAPAEEHPKMFLKLGQLALRDIQGAKQWANEVHQVCMQHADMPEASVADTLYAAIADNKKNASAALKRLSVQAEPDYPVVVTLELLSRYAPNILDEFFNKNRPKDLSYFWQNLYIESLVRQIKYDHAQKLVSQQLDKNPNAVLYMQAGYISLLKKEPTANALNFFDKAYAIGNKNEQSRTALFASIGALQNNDPDTVKKWVNKIHDGDYDYDKLSIQASLADNDKQWDKMGEALEKIEKLNTKRGRFFNEESYIRMKVKHISYGQEPEKALKELSEKIDQAEKTPHFDEWVKSILYHARGTLYADKMRQFDKAVADLEKYWQFDKDDPNAQNTLGYTLLFVPERIDEGVALIEKSIKQIPDSAPVQDSLGWGYYLQGKTQKALPYLQSAYAKMPEAEVAAHLGEVLWQLGKKEEARTIWEQGYKKDKDDMSLKEILKKFNVSF
ncbi:MAG: tetratricopeptide repeat protein [Neisseriaceae bacterium]|nr:tetratricopeptide repeat protein [Neisseriaceae bacterium]